MSKKCPDVLSCMACSRGARQCFDSTGIVFCYGTPIPAHDSRNREFFVIEDALGGPSRD